MLLKRCDILCDRIGNARTIACEEFATVDSVPFVNVDLAENEYFWILFACGMPAFPAGAGTT